jgi:hypothetical protein
MFCPFNLLSAENITCISGTGLFKKKSSHALGVAEDSSLIRGTGFGFVPKIISKTLQRGVSDVHHIISRAFETKMEDTRFTSRATRESDELKIGALRAEEKN